MGTQKRSNATSSGLVSGSARRKQQTINVNTLDEGGYYLYWSTEDGSVDESKEAVNVGQCSSADFDSVLSSWVDLYSEEAATDEERADAEKYDIFDRGSWPLGHRLFALQQCITQLDYFPLVEAAEEQSAETEPLEATTV
jgi:hypothetical protein